MTHSDQYDVAIIGGGPGGYVAGIRAAQLGLRSCVVEKDALGGVCLNWGCIPSKNLLHQAELVASRRELESIGAGVDLTTLDYAKVHKKSRQAAGRLVKGVEFLLKKNNVEVIKGTASIASKNKVALSDGAEIQAKNIVIATGSRPFTLPGFEFDEDRVLSSTGILDMKELPKSLVILGAGAIGCEFAHVMNAFGVRVILVEMVDHILPFEDEETVAELEKSFRKRGIKVMTGARALNLEKGSDGVTVTVEAKGGLQQLVEAEKALCVFGRTPNTDNLGLGNVGLETEKGYIPVRDYCQTDVPGIFAIGDVVNTPLLAHVASKEGEIAVEYIAGHNPAPRIDVNEIPSAIYCEPQVASFGLRETQAKMLGVAYKKSVFPYRGVGKPIAVGKAEGMVKILFDPESTQILGGHIVGHGATELIHEVLLAKCAGLLPKDVANMIHAHPTVCETIMEAMRGAGGQPIHM